MADDEPQWLTTQEQRAWLALVGMVTWLPVALDAQLRRDAGISHFEYQVLAMLSMTDGHAMRMLQLGRLANAALPRLSRTIDRLQRRGWVVREPDPQDGRSTLARLTEAGWDKVVASAPGHVAEVRRLVLDPLTTDQVRELGDIATAIHDVVNPDGGPLPSPG